MAELDYQRSELDAALRLVTEGVARRLQFIFARPLATALATLAWTARPRVIGSAPWEAMDEAVQAAPGQAVADLMTRSRLSGRGYASPRVTPPAPNAGYVSAASTHMTSRATPVSWRIWCWPGCCSPGTVPPRHSPARPAGRWRRSPRSAPAARSRWAPQALALAACGDNAAAVGALAGAPTSAAPRATPGIRRRGAPMRALLGRRIAAQRSEHDPARVVPLDHLARLLRVFDGQHIEPGPGQVASAAVPGLVEPLTARWFEVLGFLAAGKSNPRIAGELPHHP